MLGENLCEDQASSAPTSADLMAVPLNKAIFGLYWLAGVFLNRVAGDVWAPIANPLRSEILRLFCLGELQKKISRFGPDLIIAEDMYAAPVSLLVARRLQIVFVYRAHHIYSSIYVGHSLEKVLRKWESSVLKNADFLLTLTDEDREEIQRLFGIDAEVGGFGLDLPDPENDFDPFSLKENEYVMYVSSYLGRELEWLRKAASSFPSTTFVFVGQGSLALVDLPPNVKRLGIVSEHDLLALYRHCRFVLIPFEWKPGQGVPIKLIEAFRSGKPILLNEKAAWLLHCDANGIVCFAEKNFFEKLDLLLHEKITVVRNSCSFSLSPYIVQLERKLGDIKAHGIRSPSHVLADETG